MRVKPTLGTGRQGWERLMGSRVAGLPSQRPGTQEEKVAKPPAGGWMRRVSGGGLDGEGEQLPSLPLHRPQPSLPASPWLEHLVSVLVLEGSRLSRSHHPPLSPHPSSCQSGAGLPQDAAVMPIKVEAAQMTSQHAAHAAPTHRQLQRPQGSSRFGVGPGWACPPLPQG